MTSQLRHTLLPASLIGVLPDSRWRDECINGGPRQVPWSWRKKGTVELLDFVTAPENMATLALGPRPF